MAYFNLFSHSSVDVWIVCFSPIMQMHVIYDGEFFEHCSNDLFPSESSEVIIHRS